MTDPALKAKIKELLRREYFGDPEDAVYVTDSDEVDDAMHVIIVSPKFRGRRFQEKEDLIWSVLTQSLPPEEWGRVTLSVGVSPEEIKGL